MEEAGYVAGLMVGPYFLGRAVTGWVWTELGKCLGYRVTFNIAILLETALTFLFGAFTNVWVGVTIRAVAGVFSPLNVLSQLVLSHLSVRFGDDIPLVSETVAFVASAGQATGFLLGGCLSYPLENELVDEKSVFSGEPFLLPIIIVGVVQFVALLFFFLDFPDLMVKVTKNKTNQKEENKENMGKYAQLSESGLNNTDLQRSEGAILPSDAPELSGNPVTQREEKEVAENEEDIPAYLQCYELEEGEEYVEEPPKSPKSVGNGSHRGSARVIDVKPGTSRTKVIAKVISHELPYTPPPDLPINYRPDKTTHISFIEENFSNSRVFPCESLEDRFKRPANCSVVPRVLGTIYLCLNTLIVSGMEGMLVTWIPLVPNDGLNLLLLGVVLAGSVTGVWFLLWTFSVVSRYFRLFYAGIGHHIGLGICSLVPVLLTLWRPGGVTWVFALIALAFFTRYFGTFAASYGELLISDSVPIDGRPCVFLYAETLAAGCKCLGYVAGPFLFAYSMSISFPELAFLVATGLIALSLLLTPLIKPHFPRFLSTPYTM